MTQDYTEKTLNSKLIYQGKIIRVLEEVVQLPNGKETKREIVQHNGAVGILAINTANKIILVKQFRKAINETILEIPAGKLEPNEKPIDCAFRELREETGYIADNMTKINKLYTSPGFADEVIYLFKANDLKKGVASPDEDEFVDVVELSLFEISELIRKGEIKDAKTLVALYFWQTEVLKGRM